MEMNSHAHTKIEVATNEHACDAVESLEYDE